MPRLKILKRVYHNKKSIRSSSSLLNFLRHSYSYRLRDLRQLFGIKDTNGVDKFFKRGYNNLTIEYLDKLCSMMSDHDPHEILKMILMDSGSNYGNLHDIVRRHEHIDKVIDIYASDREKRLEEALKRIINAKKFEDKQKAITRADNMLKNISFNYLGGI